MLMDKIDKQTEMLNQQSVHINQQTEKLRDVTIQLNSVSAELRKVKVTLRANDAPVKAQTLPVHKYTKMLPLNSYADLMVFESTMDRVEMVEHLMKVRGNTAQKMVANIVSTLYSPALQVSTTWRGKRSPDGVWVKHPMAATRMPQIVAEVVQGAFGRKTKEDILEMMQKHLMHATDRSKKLQKRQIYPHCKLIERI